MAEKEERVGFYFRVGQGDTLMREVLGYFQNQGWGKLTTATRNGLRLIWDLSHQRTDVLEELFPFVRNHYCGDTDPGERQKIIEETVKLVIKQQSQSRSSHNADIPDIRESGFPAMAPKQAGQGIGKLANRAIAMPIIEDEPDDGATIVLTKHAAENTGANFAAGLASLGLFS